MNSIKMMYVRLISEFVGERVVYKLVRGSGCLREWVVDNERTTCHAPIHCNFKATTDDVLLYIELVWQK